MATEISLNPDQQAALQALQRFVQHPAADTFVLKGYAGTGKTFLMQHFAKWLKENNLEFSLLASTGRAATVLRGKTGFDATTVHGELYRFSRVDGDDEDLPHDAPADRFGQMSLQFSLRPPDDKKVVYIIDEASMLASEMNNEDSVISFGSGQLLPDFFAAAGNNKIIFVGDPGQLPPVGQEYSPALDMNWLASEERTAISMTLEKIERNDAGNDILVLASAIRDMKEDLSVRFPRLPARYLKNVHIYPSDKELFEAYLDNYNRKGPAGSLAVARSNKMVADINRDMRQEIFGESDLPLQVGDILMVVQNNQSVPLTNGDFVEVTGLGEKETHVNLHFQIVRVKAVLSGIEHELLIALDVLYGSENNHTRDQSRMLMIDFSRRMRQKRIRVNSEVYKQRMMKDKVLNCLKAKFGYGVTCHKAQGGEWDDVYLFLNSKMYGMPQPELFRWWYTAVTRAKKRLHLTDGWWLS
ncbi:MAG: DEAD/DEAH box helicase [Chitinophagaceae bacterium]|nr:DEAD/DEAH box helicase [Chitinophagaceae bacterium]